MHELSVAIALVDLVRDAAAKLHTTRVEAVRVAIGPLAGVVEDALRSSFDLVVAGGPLAGAALEIRQVPLVAYCTACNEEMTIEAPQHLRCPVCGSLTPDIRSGRDLQLVALEVPDVEDCGDSSEHSDEERSAGG